MPEKMKSSRIGGFTVVEMLVALMIGGILAGIVFRQQEPARARAAVRSAVLQFNSMHALARAAAVERGAAVLFIVDPIGDSVAVRQGSELIETLHFDTELSVDVRAPAELRVCMTPRGLANPDCGNVQVAREVELRRHDALRTLRLLPYGQVLE